jgi:hypothetical protein
MRPVRIPKLLWGRVLAVSNLGGPQDGTKIEETRVEATEG